MEMPHHTVSIDSKFTAANHAVYTQTPPALPHDVSLLVMSGAVLSAAKIGQVSTISRRDSFLDSPAFLKEQSKIRDAICKLEENWGRHLFDPYAPTDVDTISETIEYAYDAISQFGPGAVDLTKISLPSLNSEHISALLRATFSFRDKTPGWQRALFVAQMALERDGIDVNDALAGLL